MTDRLKRTRHRGIFDTGKAYVVRYRDLLGILHRLHQRDRAVGHLTERPDDLRVPRVADEQYVPPFLDQPLRLAVDLGHERTGRVDKSEAAVLRLGRYRFGHAVGREDHRPVVGHFVELIDEHGAEPTQPLDHRAVMDDPYEGEIE